MSLSRIKILAPLFFWIFQVLIHVIRNIYIWVAEPFFSIFETIIIVYPLDIVTFVIFYYYFSPKFLKKERTKFNVFLSVFYIIFYGFVWVVTYYYWQTTDYEPLKSIYFSSFGHTVNYAFLGIIFRLGIEWFEKRDKEKELEKQNAKTELALLRAQINPHFLFNTLNNINSFAQTNSEKTSFAIIKLSEIMRYMLYEANSEKVFLEKEIQYIRNFIELQKLRYKNPNFIDFQAIGIATNILIPPMLFIPFIENVFKHGKKTEEEKIEIRIDVKAPKINFYCKNAKRVLSETEKIGFQGIGISNIKRRLEILFPESYKLEISENEKHYIVNLIIENYEN